MPDIDKIQEFLDKLKPCIDKGELDACVDECVGLAKEMGISPLKLLNLAVYEGLNENKNNLAIALALAAERGISGKDKSIAFFIAGLGANIEKIEESTEYYEKAITLNPTEPSFHYHLSAVLYYQNQNNTAEEHLKTAIKLKPTDTKIHIIYCLFLLLENKFEDFRKEIKLLSKLTVKKEDIQLIHILKGKIFDLVSNKYHLRKKYLESSDFASSAGEEYLNAAKIEEGFLKNDLLLLGNILKAKSFIRKEQRNLKELIENLKNASEFYKKASVCQVGGKQEVCGACHGVMYVFSQVLTALDDVVKEKAPSINKDEWHNVLKKSREIYLKIKAKDKAKKGTDLVDALEQFIKCVDELDYYNAMPSKVQGIRTKKCSEKLIDVSLKIEGEFRNITDPVSDIIDGYLRKMGIPIYEKISIEPPPLTFYQKWIKPIQNVIGLIFIGIIVSRILASNLDIKFIEYIKYLIP